MAETIGARLKHAWNAFLNRDPTYELSFNERTYYSRPDRQRSRHGAERSIIASIFNRISLDASSISIQHIRTDENERYVETIESGLNNCFTLEANLDQTGRAFIQDAVYSMLDEGCVALVPIDTTLNPKTSSFDINTIRVGKIVEWMPSRVKVSVYNERTGEREDVILPKKMLAIIENPFYSIMNESNSTMQRLIRKLSLLDIVDEQSSAGKLDLIIQLPYVIKNKLKETQAENRRASIEKQLADSKYGIAYTDGTERITQLNRPLENNLLKQIEYLTNLALSQLGITIEILNGTADEKTMLNYYNRIIEPILTAITIECERKFLTKTARTQKQAIRFFREPFKLVPLDNLAELADKFTRNEIMSSNEIRQVIGMKPSSDPKADQLVNSNISQDPLAPPTEPTVPLEEPLILQEGIQEEEIQNE